MATIDGRHWYRFQYLKSEEWETIRLIKLAQRGFKCDLCGVYDLSNDVHHVKYPKDMKDTRAKHLRVLCRGCHKKVHKVLDELPKMNHKHAGGVWAKTVVKFRINERKEKGILTNKEFHAKSRRVFKASKHRLKLVYRGVFKSESNRRFYKFFKQNADFSDDQFREFFKNLP